MTESDPSGPSSGLTGSAQPQHRGDGREGSFWGESPGLRRLTVAATALTVGALALSALLPQSEDKPAAAVPPAVGPPASTVVTPGAAAPAAPAAAATASAAATPGPATAPTGIPAAAPTAATAPTGVAAATPAAATAPASIPAAATARTGVAAATPAAATPVAAPAAATTPAGNAAAVPAAATAPTGVGTAPTAMRPPAPVATPPAPAVPLHVASAAPVPVPQPTGGGAAQPSDDTQACRITAPGLPQHFGVGVVVGFENHDISLARIQLTQTQMGGKIDPAYIDLQRVHLRMPNGRIVTFIQPKNLTVRIGDRVTVQDSYRNVNLPCNYIPQQITSDLGPAQNPPAPANGPTAPPADGDQAPPTGVRQ